MHIFIPWVYFTWLDVANYTEEDSHWAFILIWRRTERGNTIQIDSVIGNDITKTTNIIAEKWMKTLHIIQPVSGESCDMFGQHMPQAWCLHCLPQWIGDTLLTHNEIDYPFPFGIKSLTGNNHLLGICRWSLPQVLYRPKIYMYLMWWA